MIFWDFLPVEPSETMEFELDELIILLLRWLRLELLTCLLKDLEDLERLDPSHSLLSRSESLDYLLP